MLLSRRLVDFSNGVIAGLMSGVFAVALGFLFGKLIICGYSIAIIAP